MTDVPDWDSGADTPTRLCTNVHDHRLTGQVGGAYHFWHADGPFPSQALCGQTRHTLPYFDGAEAPKRPDDWTCSYRGEDCIAPSSHHVRPVQYDFGSLADAINRYACSECVNALADHLGFDSEVHMLDTLGGRD